MNRDEQMTTSETGGSKASKQARIGSLDPASLLEVAEVAGFGEDKYSRLNYMNGFEWHLSFDALQRHALLWWSGEGTDPESGLSHMAHVAWQALCLMAFARHGVGTDTRYVKDSSRELEEAYAEFEKVIGLPVAACVDAYLNKVTQPEEGK